MSGQTSFAHRAFHRLETSLNFYRIHLLFFTFTPLIFSAIFYASNGEMHVSYIDSLFNCTSAMTVTGLATVNLSGLTGWQQAILFILSSLGSTVAVSWVMVYVRTYFFRVKFEHIVASQLPHRQQSSETRNPIFARISSPYRRVVEVEIPRTESPVNETTEAAGSPDIERLAGDHAVPASATNASKPQASQDEPPRTHTVEFSDPVQDVSTKPRTRSEGSNDQRPPLPRTARKPLGKAADTIHGKKTPPVYGKTAGFGGFPSPPEILALLARKAYRAFGTTFIKIRSKPNKVVDKPRGATLLPYLSFETVTGRNSTFVGLSGEKTEELGGVEYRALKILLWVVGFYHILVQLLAFTIIAPYMSISKWDGVFSSQIRYLPSTWYSAFQTVSAYTNSGQSLVDTSMIPFQTAYPMIVGLMVLILAGNTAFPIFLRATIWTLKSLVSKRSRLRETLHFLLDHPRRCFIYLFPKDQTILLLLFLILLNSIDWVSFLVLDIGNPEIDSIPRGRRVFLGLFQAFCVRSAGFASVNLAALSPAVKVLYVMMMYVSVYPIALSVRSTNVYEEQSLGIFHPEHPDTLKLDDPHSLQSGLRGSYLSLHARQQLAFDMWWLGAALWLICIIERSNLNNPETQSWFNIFQIMFEVVSGYGTVGLSLGIPNQDYSFSGAFRPLSKLIMCIVMLRGRHRGLPVAIDRAILLPSEYKKKTDDGAKEDGEEHEMTTPPAQRT